MSNINSLELYNLNTIDINNINDDDSKDSNEIINFFWAPNKGLVDKLCLFLKNTNKLNNIIDIGSGSGDAKFPLATHLLDFNDIGDDKRINIRLDLDFDKFKQTDRFFEFIYCRHTLEDIQNPLNAFNEFIRISKSGYIETPSPLVELTKNVDAGNLNYRGYIHHRYIVWSNYKNNTIYFLPKYPIVEHITFNKNIIKTYNYILNNFSVYWNNYFFWDTNTKPNIVVYRNDINFKIHDDYARLLNEAIYSSIEYTNIFISFIKNI